MAKGSATFKMDAGGPGQCSQMRRRERDVLAERIAVRLCPEVPFVLPSFPFVRTWYRRDRVRRIAGSAGRSRNYGSQPHEQQTVNLYKVEGHVRLGQTR